MDHASKQRFSAEGEEVKKQTIRATDEWWEELQRMPYISRKYNCFWWFNEWFYIEKNGKTLNLLKASAKKINPNKKRKVIRLLGTITDYHVANQAEAEAS